MNALCQAMEFTPYIKPGKQAIKREHRDLLLETRAVKVTKSLDFDRALADQELEHKRWDYFVEASSQVGRSHAVEVHAFERSVLVQKKKGTVALLQNRCPRAVTEIASWTVLIKGDLPRQDLIARFRADSGIRLDRKLHVSKL